MEVNISYDEKVCLCALNRLFGYKSQLAGYLLKTFGSAKTVFNVGEKELKEYLDPYSGGFKLLQNINRESYLEQSFKDLDTIRSIGGRVIGINERDYPALLKECDDAPICLYYLSTSPAGEIFNKKESISIVGTRNISLYGIEWCQKITSALAQFQTSIVSGLALGTDIIAHRCALEHGASTIAVMATGIDKIYPRQHEAIAEKIYKTKGSALISDFSLGTDALKINFLRRNRIIAGLSKATILIESKIKGGGLITCKQAFAYNRDVYCLPGRIDDLKSQGCNMLINQQLANPITSIDFLIKDLLDKRLSLNFFDENLDKLEKDFNGEGLVVTMQSALKKVISQIKNNRGITVNELCIKMNMTYPQILQYLEILQDKDLIKIDLLQRCMMKI